MEQKVTDGVSKEAEQVIGILEEFEPRVIAEALSHMPSMKGLWNRTIQNNNNG